MKTSRSFILYWILNTLIFYFTPFLVPGFIVSGNVRLTAFLSSIISGFILAIFDALGPQIAAYFKFGLKKEWKWAITLMLTNIAGIWLISRSADLTGVGIKNIWVVIFLASLLTISQWFFESQLQKG